MGGVQVKDLLSNTFFVLAVCGGKIFSNFLKFSQIFSKGGGGCQIGGGGGGVVGYIFSIGIFVVNLFLKFSQIFSEYIFMYWHSGKIFSKFLKSFS